MTMPSDPKEALADLQSHQAAWRNGLEIARHHAEPPGVDHDDPLYWAHELAVFDRVFSEVPAIISERDGLAAKVERLTVLHGLAVTDTVHLVERAEAAEAKLSALNWALTELRAMVQGECPSLLNEDSGGDGALSIAIDGLLDPTAPVEDFVDQDAADAWSMSAEALEEALAAVPVQDVAALCSDCPPVGYITDKTRCAPCPRRAALLPVPPSHGSETNAEITVSEAFWVKQIMLNPSLDDALQRGLRTTVSRFLHAVYNASQPHPNVSVLVEALKRIKDDGGHCAKCGARECACNCRSHWETDNPSELARAALSAFQSSQEDGS